MSVKMDSEEIRRIMRETLTPKHALDTYVVAFIGNYVVCKEVKQAAILSGITAADGHYLINQPDIYKCVQKIVEKAVMKYGYDAEQVVERVKELAFVDVAELFDDEGRLIENIKSLPPEITRTIKKFKYKSYFEPDHNGMQQYAGRIYEVEMWDKPKSLELLAREKDTFKRKDVIEHDISKNATSFLLGSMELANQRMVEMRDHVSGALPQRAIDVTPVEEPVKYKFDPPPGFGK